MRIENELNKVVGFLYAKMPNEELVVTLDQEVGTTFCRNVESHICSTSSLPPPFKAFFQLCVDASELLIEGNGFRKGLQLCSSCSRFNLKINVRR